jgi:hypothetical protein
MYLNPLMFQKWGEEIEPLRLIRAIKFCSVHLAQHG